ncbi:SDR family oxidoreductase [Nonomuraea typhae]|uniref:SDR family oxidoreductase n=1 Tax=Nonomuraea typhae TaxID=2603600 RepID=UPI0012F812A6|nr:SDR family oxidoreductase [Nonomuraea typhae]
MTDNLKGRTAIVTGASSGIGAATATLLAARGARVALLARREERLTGLVQEIKQAGGEAIAAAADVAGSASVATAVERVLGVFGGVDLVVNNAGIMLPAPAEQADLADWESQIDVNVTGALRVVHALTPSLLRAAATGPADLINISSIASHVPFPSFAAYTASKAAVTHLSATLRAELGGRGVRVTAVEPGIVATELQGHVTDPAVNEWLDGVIGSIQVLSAQDVAEVIAFTAAQPAHVNLSRITVYPTRQA